MRAQHYDAVFLGDRTPTLLGAAFLARRGFRVLVLGEETLGERSGSPAFLLPLESPPIRALFEALALLPTIRRRALESEWAASMRFHEKCLDLPRDPAARLAVLDREFPESALKLSRFERSARELVTAFDALLREGHGPFATGLLARRAHRSFERRRLSESFTEELDPIAPLRSQGALLEALSVLISLHTGLPPRSLPPAAETILYMRLLEGSIRLSGGEAWLRDQLIEALRDHGGAIERKRPVGEILLKKNRVDGIRFGDGRDEIGASMIIAGLREARLNRLLGEPRRAATEANEQQTLASTLVRIPERALPVGLGAHLYFKPKSDAARGLAFYLERLERETVGGREYQLTAISEEAPISRMHLEAAFEELFPLSAEALDFESPRLSPAPRSSDDESAHRSIFELSALPIDQAARGLFLAGPDNLPELGTEGEFLAIAATCRRALQSTLGRSHARFHPLRSLD